MGVTFVDFWTAYPKRKGANPRKPAEDKFNLAVKKGADAAHIISSAARYRDESKEQNLIDTPYVCMAVTWLNQQRWLDYAPSEESDQDRWIKMAADMEKRGYVWNGAKWEQVKELNT